MDIRMHLANAIATEHKLGMLTRKVQAGSTEATGRLTAMLPRAERFSDVFSRFASQSTQPGHVAFAHHSELVRTAHSLADAVTGAQSALAASHVDDVAATVRSLRLTDLTRRLLAFR